MLERDLFSTEVYLSDEGLIEELFEAGLSAEAARFEGLGWKWIEPYGAPGFSRQEARAMGFTVIEPDHTGLTQSEEHERRRLRHLRDLAGLSSKEEIALTDLENRRHAVFSAEQMAVSGVIVHVLADGRAEAIEGLVRRDDHESVAGTETVKGKAHTTFGEKLREDLAAIELAAVQTALLRRPDLLFDLVAFSLSGEGPAKIGCFDIRADRPRNRPANIMAGFSLPMSLDPDTSPGVDREMKPRGEADMFKIFRGRGVDHRDDILTAGLASLVRFSASRNGLYALLAREAGADMREVWRPTAENLFRRVKTAYLDTLFVTLLQPKRGDERLKLWKKLRKWEKSDLLDALFTPENTARDAYGLTMEQKKQIDTWTPAPFGMFDHK